MISISLRNFVKKLREELDEYKVRHPKNTGIKNGAPFFFKPEIREIKKKRKRDQEG